MIPRVRPWKLSFATMMVALSWATPLLTVAPGSSNLDGRFHGLGAGVHRQDHVLCDKLGELLTRTGPSWSWCTAREVRLRVRS